MRDVDLLRIACEEDISTVVHSHQSSAHLCEVQLYLVLVILIASCDLWILDEFPVAVSSWLKFATVATKNSLVVRVGI